MKILTHCGTGVSRFAANDVTTCKEHSKCFSDYPDIHKAFLLGDMLLREPWRLNALEGDSADCRHGRNAPASSESGSELGRRFRVD